MEILDKVLNYIKKHNLISYNDSIICAVSGGADSVCMLDILNTIKDVFNLSLYVAHLNHNLRGEEAVRDENFVKDLCEKYSLPFYTKTVDVNSLSKHLKVSCEEAGRIARYEFFNKLKSSLNAVKIATAHNKNDNTETVLMRILRGTDLKGLAGISCFNENNVIRPILCLTRCEIEEYLRCKGLYFVTDSTNLANDFTRNKIRNDLIPKLTHDFNGSFTEVFASNIELFNEANDFIEECVNSEFSKLVKRDFFGFTIDATSLSELNSYIVKRIIKKAVFELSGLNISNNLCEILYNSIKTETSITVNEKVDFYTKYNKIYFVLKRKKENFSYKIDALGTYYIPEISSYLEVSEGTGAVKFDDKNTIFLDCNKIALEFLLRSRTDGDKMYLKNCGTKKIKDVLIDEKVPAFLRDYIPVLEYNDKIIWLCGVRDDATYRCKTNDNYIKISLHKENDNA